MYRTASSAAAPLRRFFFFFFFLYFFFSGPPRSKDHGELFVDGIPDWRSPGHEVITDYLLFIFYFFIFFVTKNHRIDHKNHRIDIARDRVCTKSMEDVKRVDLDDVSRCSARGRRVLSVF